jgi:GH24 family phage-related lysozyme (muramidase)
MQKAMDISQAGLTALAGREGIRTLAYKDSVGVWTIGVGHTAAAGLPNPCAGMEISHQAALDLFKIDLRQYAAEVNRAVKVDCTQNQFDAMVSLCFNIGIGGFAGSSVVRDLNEGDLDRAAQAFLLWDHPEELLGRRKAERAQFLLPGDRVPLWHATAAVKLAPPVADVLDVETIGGLQAALRRLGYPITVDGDYGPETRQAVSSFQMHSGIVADGVCGPQTEAELRKELAAL